MASTFPCQRVTPETPAQQAESRTCMIWHGSLCSQWYVYKSQPKHAQAYHLDRMHCGYTVPPNCMPQTIILSHKQRAKRIWLQYIGQKRNIMQKDTIKMVNTYFSFFLCMQLIFNYQKLRHKNEIKTTIYKYKVCPKTFNNSKLMLSFKCNGDSNRY